MTLQTAIAPPAPPAGRRAPRRWRPGRRARRAGKACLLLTLAVCGCAGLTPTETAGPADAGPSPEAAKQALHSYLADRDAEAEDDGAYYRPWIAVLPFVDDSGFREGVWGLRHGPASLLSRRMAPSSAWRVVPYDAVRGAVGATVDRLPREWDDRSLGAVAETLHVDLLVSAHLLDYNMERLEVGDPLLGGYKSYRGVAEAEAQVLRVTDGARLGTAHAVEEVVDRGLGIDLLGKPREQDLQFANLHQMAYGGEEFQGTAIGQATLLTLDKLVEQMARSVRPRAINVATGTAQILSVFGDEVFINVGSENGVHVGYRFAVYPGPGRGTDTPVDERLGVLEVTQIIGAGVSKVSAVSGAGRLGVGDRLELIGVEPE